MSSWFTPAKQKTLQQGFLTELFGEFSIPVSGLESNILFAC